MLKKLLNNKEKNLTKDEISKSMTYNWLSVRPMMDFQLVEDVMAETLNPSFLDVLQKFLNLGPHPINVLCCDLCDFFGYFNEFLV